MSLIRTVVVSTNTLGQLLRREQVVGFDHRAFAMHPFGFDGIDKGGSMANRLFVAREGLGDAGSGFPTSTWTLSQAALIDDLDVVEALAPPLRSVSEEQMTKKRLIASPSAQPAVLLPFDSVRPVSAWLLRDDCGQFPPIVRVERLCSPN
jgi:hypothetical protein